MKLFRCLAALLLPLLLAAPAVRAEDTTGAIGGASFSVEQVYVNVPEVDVFFYAADPDGTPISPTQVQAAGVELTLGDTALDTGLINTSTAPVCYLFVVDDARLSARTLSACRTALHGVLNRKAADDQIGLYSASDGGWLLEPTSDAAAVRTAVNKLTVREGQGDLTQTAAALYAYVQGNFQSLAPRKAAFVLTEGADLMQDLALLGAAMSGAADGLNMPFDVLLVSSEPELLEPLSGLSGGLLTPLRAQELGAWLTGRCEKMATALQIRTEIDESCYGETMETLTLAVPRLGSAVRSSHTVYMGHRLTKPAVEKVEVISRTRLRLTFNQAVDNAAAPSAYRITSSDIWNYPVAVTAVELAENGRTAVLTTEPLYEGRYGIRLSRVTSGLSSANVSDARAETTFRVAVWPRDNAFYLARFRLPLLMLGGALLVLALYARRLRRRDRTAEQAAEAEHLLRGGEQQTLPRRWLTLFIREHGSIAESRWSGMVESSLILGSDAAQCDLALRDDRAAPQHCALCIEGDAVLVQPLDGAPVYVNGEQIGGAHRLQNSDTLRVGRTTLQLVL